jgi:hypothetical protein
MLVTMTTTMISKISRCPRKKLNPAFRSCKYVVCDCSSERFTATSAEGIRNNTPNAETIPVDPTEAFMGPEYAKWYASNGEQGREPEDPEMLKILELFRGAAGQKSEQRIETAKEIWKILIDQQYGIGTVGQSPALLGVRLGSNKLGTIPGRNCIAQHCRTPGGAHPETWFYKE